MKVKIIKTTSFQEWWHERTGEEVEVAEDQGNQYLVKVSHRYGKTSVIPKWACEITDVSPDLSQVTDDALIAEVKKRGITIYS
jgi:uncharacterized protein YgiM (DUF1202 family)